MINSLNLSTFALSTIFAMTTSAGSAFAADKGPASFDCSGPASDEGGGTGRVGIKGTAVTATIPTRPGGVRQDFVRFIKGTAHVHVFDGKDTYSHADTAFTGVETAGMPTPGRGLRIIPDKQGKAAAVESIFLLKRSNGEKTATFSVTTKTGKKIFKVACTKLFD